MAKLGEAGVIAMDLTVFVTAVTVSAAVPLTPLKVAVMVLEPAATAVARPDALIVAAAVLELVHAAVVLTLAVELSL
jgi:hypothetical protein